MRDITELLRSKPPVYEICVTAAEEIERLRQAIQAGFGWDDKYHWYVGSRQMEKFAALVAAAEREALDEQIRSINHDCRIMCNALQRIEAGEAEPRMIARRTLEHWSEKSALEVKP